MFNACLNSGTMIFVFFLFGVRLFLFMLYPIRRSFRIPQAYLYFDCLICVLHFIGGGSVLVGGFSNMHSSFGWMFIAFGVFHLFVLIPSWIERTVQTPAGVGYKW